MNIKSLITISVLSAVLTTSVAQARIHGAEVDNDVILKLSREIAKGRLQRHRKTDEYIKDDEVKDLSSLNRDDTDSCGNVDIGNLESSGIGDIGDKEVNVVIIGDVINAGNRCN